MTGRLTVAQKLNINLIDLFAAKHTQMGKTLHTLVGLNINWQIRADLDIGIATGGWSHSAQAKLSSAGLDTEGVPLASSDDHPARVEIMKRCAARLEGSDERPVYVGDGEWDAAACADLGWAFIGIGDRLKGQCPVWIPNYAVVDLTEQIEHALAACNGDWVRA